MVRPFFSFLLIISFHILFFSKTLAADDTELKDPLFCYASCIAKCVTENSDETGKSCQNECESSKTEKCQLTRLPAVSTSLTVDHGQRELADRPYDAYLSWKPISGAVYILQTRTLELDDWENLNDVVDEPHFNFTKKDGPCAIYSFRVIPVTSNGVGIPSDTSNSGPARIQFHNPDEMFLRVTSMRMVDESVLNVTVEYHIATEWRYPDAQASVSFVPHSCPLGSVDKTFMIDETHAGFLIKRRCAGVFVVEGVSTLCHRSLTRLPSTVSRKMFEPYDGMKCSSFPGCMTTEPSCDHVYACVVEMNVTAEEGCSEQVAVDVSWSYTPSAPSYEPCTVKGLYVEHGYMDDSYGAESPIGQELVGNVREIADNFFLANVSVRSFSLLEYPNDTLVVRSCAIFDRIKFEREAKNSGEFRGALNRAPRAVMDLRETQKCFSKQNLSDVNVVAIAAPLTVALLCLLVVVFVALLKHRQQSKRLKETEAQQNAYHQFSPYPESGDIWEIDRRLLIISEDETLGKGAFGKVLKGQVKGRAINALEAKSTIATVQESADNMLVAVKQCHEFADDQTKRDFLQEIELMKKLYSHPRLVNMVYCITKNEPYSLIVEYCELGDLLKFLRRCRDYMIEVQERGIDLSGSEIPEDVDLNMIMSFKDVATMSYQVADGMEYISQQGYIHRDIAARNILVTSNRTLKIGDFGLTRFVLSDAYMTRGGKLPVKWLALEALETYEFSSKSDIWSYGVLLFEMITLGGVPYANILPMDGDFRMAMLDFLMAGNRMEQPPNCPDEFYDLMLNTWRKSQADRPNFAEIKDILRDMIQNLSENDTGNYSDFYIDPARKYYNVTHPDDVEGTENPKIYPFGTSLRKSMSLEDNLKYPQPDVIPETKNKLRESRSCESGIGSDESDTNPRRISMESFNSTAPLVSPRTPKSKDMKHFPILYELSETAVHL